MTFEHFRKLATDNPLWYGDEPFNVAMAFLDLLFSANEKGELFTSRDKLSEKWHVPTYKVDEYLKRMKQASEVFVFQYQGAWVIRITHYEEYTATEG